MANQKFEKRYLAMGIGALALGVGLTGCAKDDNESEREIGEIEFALESFPTCDSLDDYLADVITEQYVQSAIWSDYYYYDEPMAGGGRGEATNDSAGAGGGAVEEGAPSSPDDFTTTNVQELGIDEADLLKSNGENMFVINNQTLHIIDTWPAEETQEVARLDLPGWGENMFLVEDQLVIFSGIYTGDRYYGDYGGREEPGWDDGAEPALPDDEPGVPDGDEDGADTPGDEGMPEPMPEDEWEEPTGPDAWGDEGWFSGTRVTIVDVSTPEAPSITRQFDIQGDFTNARLVDGTVYLVANSHFDFYDEALYVALSELPIETADYETTETELVRLRNTARTLVRPVIAEWLAGGGRELVIPDYRSPDGRSDLLDCASIYRPGASSGLGMLSVVAFDPATDAAPESVGLLAQGWEVYGSATSLYIAQDSRWWWWDFGAEPYAQTHIHRFALNEGSPRYAASGAVNGWLLNQFSMSEHDGVLRVATTDAETGGWRGWGAVDTAVAGGGDAVGPGTAEVSDSTEPAEAGGGSAGSEGGSDSGDGFVPPEEKSIVDLSETDEPANNVYTLRQDGRNLDIVGGIEGIAPGEQIFSVRFMGEMGYVVTFEQTDPLFTIDLSNPEEPQLLGELHIPGFSTYLHPLGEGYLIGVGRDGTMDGRIEGFQLQIFDVTDPTNPTRTHQEVLTTGDGQWSYSEAEHDHRAFTYYESRGLLAVPVTLEDYSWDSDEYSHFSGIIVYQVSPESGFTEVGRVSHSGMAHSRYCSDFPESDPEASAACEGWDYPWWTNMRRSAFVEDYLYAFSDLGVTASPISDIDGVLSEVSYY